MLTHRWVDIDPIEAEHHPLYGIAGWLPWVLAIAIAGPTWVFWQGLSVDALQIAGADLFDANTPGSGSVNLTTLLYLISCVTVLVLATTHDSAFRKAVLVHMALLPPLIGLLLMAGGVPGARATFINGMVVAVALTLTCGVYLQVSRRVRVTFELRDWAPGEHAWFRRRHGAGAGADADADAGADAGAGAGAGVNLPRAQSIDMKRGTCRPSTSTISWNIAEGRVQIVPLAAR